VVNSSCPIFFPFFDPRVFFFGNIFFLTPHACPNLTYLPRFKLFAYAPFSPPSPTYSPICLPSHQPTYLCTYALNHHKGNDGAGWWRYYNIPSRLFHSPSYLPTYLLNPKTLWLSKTMLQWPN
jgi:hypothetical protein